MNKTLSTFLIVVAVLVLAAAIFFAGSIYGRANSFGPGMMSGFGWANNNGYGPTMMNPRGGYGMGPGMMGGYGWNNGSIPNAPPLSVDQAKQAAQNYLQALNLQGLEISEVMVFDNNAYVAVKETDTGLGAFELLVDPISKLAYPEFGPNMMWNLKYGGLARGGMMGGYGGMMGGWNYQSSTPGAAVPVMPVSKDQAIHNAQAYLDRFQPGTVAASDPEQFYGYYTLDFSKNGTVVGMLSVNGYTGEIFLHTWHGAFIEESR